MRKVVLFAVLVLSAGCESMRFAPSERQKQNAWLHNRTAMMAAQRAKRENTSKTLQALTELSERQSRAFVAYCGLPRQFPKAENADDILRQSVFVLADEAVAESAERPDSWQLADRGLELAIGIASLLGGVYGTRAVRFLKEARSKSQALKEIILGNELFKKQNQQQASAFKKAHAIQSATTREIVARMKPA